MSDFTAWYQCIDGCSGTHPLNAIIYKCPKCGGLLEVAHDVSKLRKRSPAAWRTLFESRYMRTSWPYGSGVWGKKEWVCPAVADENVVSMFEGGTNLFWAQRFGQELGLEDLWIKQCGNSHTGSFKDLGMTVLVSMVKQMISEGADIRAVACASTGDTSAALAAYCASAGIQAVVILPKDKVSVAQLIQPIANGALTLAVESDFDGCMALVKQLTETPDIYLANSMNSLRIEGQKTVSIEIAQQFDWTAPDWVIVPGGNLGNVSALGKGFAMLRDVGLVDRLPRLVVAQAQRANPLYESYVNGFSEFTPKQAEKTLASAIQIGNPVSVKKAIRVLRKFDGIVEQASEDELANAAARADRTGLFNCPHTGVALAALIKLRERDVIRCGERVVVLSTAHGLKFTDFKLKYHEGALPDVPAKHVNQPVTIPPSIDAVREAVGRVASTDA